MIIEIKDSEQLFKIHAELNQIYGAIIGILDKKRAPIDKAFPEFTKMLNKINDEMKKHSVT